MDAIKETTKAMATAVLGIVFTIGILAIAGSVWIVVDLKLNSDIHTITSVNGISTLYYSIETDNTLLIELIK